MTEVIVTAEALREFYVAVFQAVGVPRAHSEVCADGLHYGDLHGVGTHGAASLNRLYLRMVRAGEVDPAAVPALVRDSGAVAVVDGGNGFGFVTARFALREAAARARQYGVGAVAARNSSHCGCLGWYTALAAEQGLVCMAFTNLGAQGVLPPPGGRTRMLGTNVLSASAPSRVEAPFRLDMSAAVAATGKVRQARDRGEPVPEGWLADEDGRPVIDPGAYFSGAARLQFLGGGPATGGHKGYGLAILADVLCGVLSGAASGPGPSPAEGREDADIGHFLLAVDVAAFREPEAFLTDMDGMLGALRTTEPLDPAHPVVYPGLPEQRYRENLAGKVRLPALVAAELASVAAELGVPGPAANV
jgi:LDH2 family malate/lactate/ureidoglycolate dehydrogenase